MTEEISGAISDEGVVCPKCSAMLQSVPQIHHFGRTNVYCTVCSQWVAARPAIASRLLPAEETRNWVRTSRGSYREIVRVTPTQAVDSSGTRYDRETGRQRSSTQFVVANWLNRDDLARVVARLEANSPTPNSLPTPREKANHDE